MKFAHEFRKLCASIGFSIRVCAFYCSWDGDKTAFDPEYENGETRDSETDLWLGQPVKWPTDGKEYQH